MSKWWIGNDDRDPLDYDPATVKHIPDLSVPGRPFRFGYPTCPHCIDLIKKQRDELCVKYNWSEWPEDLRGGIE